MAVKYSKSNIARQYRGENPDMPTLKLARIVYRDNKAAFKDVEDARTCLRYIEGKGPAKNGKAVAGTPFFRAEPRPLNPYKLPESDETDFKPFMIKGHSRVGILSDIHIPFHSIEALTSTITYLKKEKIDAILLNGDTLDCHRQSKYLKDPRRKNFAQELELFKKLLNVFEKQLGCKIYFKEGNHEERYEAYLIEKAKELVGVYEFEFESIIKARARGIEIIGQKRPVKLNSLSGIHGHEYVGGISAPVNPARGLFLRGKVSSFQGHNHQTSEHTEPTMDGKMITTWSLGCLCELHPKYMPFNKWNHGFAVVDLDKNGKDFEFRNKRIYQGKIL